MQNIELSDLSSLETWSRESLLNWLAWNDRNGIFTDKQSEAEGMEPMTKEEAIEVITRIVAENN